LTPAKRRILDGMAALEAAGIGQPSKTQLALFAKASPKSSAYANNISALRTAGLIDYPSPGATSLTEAGRAEADGSLAPTTVEELHAAVRSLVPPAKWRILERLIEAYPESLAKEELAELAGASAASSAYANNVSSLRSLGLIEYPSPGRVRARSILFLE
jgi:predicted transcriptional regulator